MKQNDSYLKAKANHLGLIRHNIKMSHRTIEEAERDGDYYKAEAETSHLRQLEEYEVRVQHELESAGVQL